MKFLKIIVSRSRLLTLLYLTAVAIRSSSTIRLSKDGLVLIRNKNRQIFLDTRHLPYARDVLENFDHYFASVKPSGAGSPNFVDFSKEAFHDVVGFEHFPLMMPSLPEPISTIEQYVALTSMKPGDVVIDLGAYSGLSSIIFQETVGRSGKVVAVEADLGNLIVQLRTLPALTKSLGTRRKLLTQLSGTH